MLNIPSEVKALFKRDDIYKNFHVRFPNGEFRDLNNEDIVTESVSFTESLCSQQFLKFGLTEASEIRFECYGVPNIRGAIIQCAIEIDVSSLGEQWICDHIVTDPFVLSDGNGDILSDENGNALGVDVVQTPFLAAQVIRTGEGEGFFRIPYGEFKVDSCQRNHEERIRRSIVAFTKIYSNNADFSDFEQYEYKKRRSIKTAKMNVCDFVATALGYIPAEYTQETNIKSDFRDKTSSLWNRLWLGNGTVASQYSLTVKSNTYSAPSMGRTYKNNYRLIKLDLVKSAGNTAINDIQAKFDQYGITGAYRSIPAQPTQEDLSRRLVRGTAKELMKWDGIVAESFFGAFESYDGDYVGIGNGVNTFTFENGAIVSFRDAKIESNGFINGDIVIPKNITVRLYDGWSQTESGLLWEQTYNMYDDFSAYAYNIPNRNELQNMEVTFNKTLDIPNSPYATIYSFYNAYSIAKIINGYFELKGVFLRKNRDKTYTEFRVVDSEHEQIQRSQYANLFYEDDEVQPVGSVRYKFANQKSEKATEYNFAYANPSVYDMTDNYVLQNLVRNKGEKDSDVETRINSALDSGFISNTEMINYVQSDIEMQALPYVESGDTIDSETEDGEAVETLVFNRTIKGIQMLRDTIQSAGGEVIGRTEDD